MPALTDFTSYASVRAALGVSTTELPDRVLELPAYEYAVELAMDSVHVLVHQRFVEIHALPAEQRSPVQAKFFKMAGVFATYAVAQFCLASMPMFTVKKLEDGKAQFERFDDVYAETMAGVNSFYANMAYRLGAYLSTLEGTNVIVPTYSTTLTTIGVTLGTDPVTAIA